MRPLILHSSWIIWLTEIKSKFKRLKQGHREDRTTYESRDVNDIFSDVASDEGYEDRRHNRAIQDEFEDFIEEDEFPDEERDRLRDEQEVARPGKRIGGLAALDVSTLDEAALEDYRAAFGDGDEYEWALELEQEQAMDQQEQDRYLELKDVFEPSQLSERMLTEEDHIIRSTDIPERLQLARKTFKPLELSEEEQDQRLKEEAAWISKLMIEELRVEPYKVDAFKWCVAKVLHFLNKDNLEIPFIFQHRKDFLIRPIKQSISSDPYNQDANGVHEKSERILKQEDLWDIYYKDLKFRGLMEKRDAVQKLYDELRDKAEIRDELVDEWLPTVLNTDETQDLHDYVSFQYSAELKDIHVASREHDGVNGTNGLKRAKSSRGAIWERIRASRAYNLVRAFGITAEAFAQNVEGKGRRQYTEDPSAHPEDMADELVDPPDYSTGSHVLRAAKAMYVEELVMSPRLRKCIRDQFFKEGVFDCVRTEKGLRQITEDHRDYEFKYLRNQSLQLVVKQRPELILGIFKAEAEGLVEFRLHLQNSTTFRKRLRSHIVSDAFSEVADAWNNLRQEVLDVAMNKLEKIVGRSVRETIKTGCEERIANACRRECSKKLDVAPFKPVGESLGTTPRVLALTNGSGIPNRDAICWVFMEEDNRLVENGKFTDLRLGNPDRFVPDGKDVQNLVEIVKRRKPDVIGVSGFTVETRKLHKDLEEIVKKHNLVVTGNNDEDGREQKLPVVIVDDEVARLYHTSERAQSEHPTLPRMAKYCVGLARFLQSPLYEYASLKDNIISISFHPDQDLLPPEKLRQSIEAAMVDIVNIVGVDLNEATNNPYVGNILPYIAGLGPRKAQHLIKVTQMNGGVWNSRQDLVGDTDIHQAFGATVFVNCASFLYVDYEEVERDRGDPLDNTRIHPEDYDLARKMCADALDLDEEDIKAETDDGGPSAVVKRMFKENLQDKVSDLELDDYAKDLETRFNQQKRATLELIGHELQDPHEELRNPFEGLKSDELFTMLTGETKESLQEGMIIPVSIKRAFPDHIEVKLDCGLEGGISEAEYPEGVGGDRGLDPRQVFQPHQTVQAKLLYLNRKLFTAQLTLREHLIRQGFRREHDHMGYEWDEEQEAADKRAAQKEKEDVSGRAQRVIKHPLFHPFNSSQAEEFLGSQGQGDVVIRPSSKGLDHLAVTWKVADNVYQHVDVLELDKENEFSVGKTLKIMGKYTYSDLDELIVNHVKAMAKKVEEMMNDERYQTGSKNQTGKRFSFLLSTVLG